MATKKHLVDRIEHIKSLIEEKGYSFKYELPKNFKKEDIFEVINKANEVYNKLR